MTLPFRTERVSSVGPLPIDHAHLEAQVPALEGTFHHEAHYLSRGLQDRLDPTRFFVTEWYAWQNPDWSRGFEAPYLHFLHEGARQGRDPSPFVDVTRFREATGGAVDDAAIYTAILRGMRAPGLGVYEDVEDLKRCQRDFLRGISMSTVRVAIPLRRRSSLVVCQAGRSPLINTFSRGGTREWDLFMNYYDAGGFQAGLGEYAVFQKGTKFSAMALLTARFPELFCAYDHVLFLDDDIETSCESLNRLFRVCRAEALDLAQMSLTAGSSCNWDGLFSRPGQAGARAVSAVEIMMPVFSRRALRWISGTLEQSISGFGLDLVWGKIVADNGGRIAILDEVTATHARPVDQSGGAYYRYLRGAGINAKAELWTLIKAYGAGRDMVSV